MKYAILYGKGERDDHPFYAPYSCVPYRDGDDFAKIVSKYMTRKVNDHVSVYEVSKSDAKEMVKIEFEPNPPIGAMIVTKDVINLLSKIRDASSINVVCKLVADYLKVGHLDQK